MSAPDTPTLLIVDDEPEILESLRRTLRREGYRLLLAGSGEAALGLLASERVDILVSDIDMPGMTGIELIGRVKREHPEVVRLLLTGAGSMDSALRAINEGEVYRFLTKPWEKDLLVRTLREAIERLAELRRTASAQANAEARSRVLDELERAHPGILDRPFEDGVYVLDAEQLSALTRTLSSPAARELLDPLTTLDLTNPTRKTP